MQTKFLFADRGRPAASIDKISARDNYTSLKLCARDNQTRKA